ncbi:Shwachman-Bodian-diamond syndrome protein [Saitoella complicata NRRL Y-17804]|uniref:Ribosome maturation protein SDO1 n=1 Tax=Saitoella complicata (strain BCRC 22490 / CBS 7301 / JCM 7358 / NBRC 10748 / NRRL Y-17804) TaxID=698492 RepID=A0A0E9NJB7_SAICN|nr:Shwachman-Bodian-diamond syndrome protein [Saitoella complicata NRRL Y-17804]ODQ50114.1 Shwachman-Bodian-diamond syndrome protein [Saitoella complicata NRRL Y-17804]GAO49893.1 hypothetical protein G7K_4030-t1 [Saitoella complicata NRRL Y-17804]
MGIFQPSGQIKLTNVSIVRLRKGGKRFEIACYKNKVQEYRSGTEKNLDEVLQISNVFMNVSKGQVASSEDLKKCFKTENVEECVAEILKKGEMQVGDKERSANQEAGVQNLVHLLSESCIDPRTSRPYPPSMLEKAIKASGFSLHPTRPVKAQMSAAISALATKGGLDIKRARMRVRIVADGKDAKKIRPKMAEMQGAEKEDEEVGEEWEWVGLIEPGLLKDLNEMIRLDTKGSGTVEVLDLKEGGAGEESFA